MKKLSQDEVFKLLQEMSGIADEIESTVKQIVTRH